MTSSHLPYPQCCVHQRTPENGGMRRSWSWLLHSPPAALVATRNIQYLVSDDLVREQGIWHGPEWGLIMSKGALVGSTRCQPLW